MSGPRYVPRPLPGQGREPKYWGAWQLEPTISERGGEGALEDCTAAVCPPCRLAGL